MVIFSKKIKKNCFTLIEFIGVIAIVTVILTMLLPNLFKRTTEKFIRDEKELLNAFEIAFKNNCMRNRRIPDHTGWVQVLSEELAIPQDQVSQVFKIPRIFLIDPQLRIGPNLTPLPYYQTTNGSALPQNLRVMIISSLSEPLPEQSGVSANFNAIWNTPDGNVPTVWQNNWRGKPESLNIKRIELSSLFKFVIINNLTTNQQVLISIDDSPPIAIPPTREGFSGFFFADTLFGFYDTNGVKVSNSVLTDDYSFVYESGAWRGQVLDGRDKANAQFQQLANLFLSAPRYSGALWGAKQINILEFFCEYARAYTVWSGENFNIDQGSPQQYPAYEQLEDYQNLLSETAHYLIGDQGKGN